MYTGLAMSRSADVQMRWTRSAFFFAIHSAALSFVIAEEHEPYILALGISFAGIILGVAWAGTIWRTNQRVRYWQDRLAKFERTGPFGQRETAVFHGREWDEMEKFPLSFRFVTMSLAVSFTLVWLGFLIGNLVMLFTYFKLFKP